MKAMAAAASLSTPTPQELHPTWRKHGRSCPPGTVAIRRDSPRASPEVARRASPFGRPAGSALWDTSEAMDTPTGKVEVIKGHLIMNEPGR